MRPGEPAAIGIQKRELHGFWAAKNCVAFLRNSLCVGHWGKGKSERFGPPVEVGQDAKAVAFFVGGSTGVNVSHAIAQGIVKQDSDLAGRRGYCLLFADPR